MINEKRPVIGITSSMSDTFIRMRRTYFDAIVDAGGIPMFMPHNLGAEDAAKFASLCDGFLFAGGDDVDPKHYGEEIAFDSVETTPLRDDFELALMEIIKNDPRPILGICRGEQILNVAFGGSLYQHIDGHRQEESGRKNLRATHVVEGSFLHSIIGETEIGVNSFHHQAIKQIAPGFTVTARADDGTVEAIEPENQINSPRFFLAVQWHPEYFYKTDAPAAKIFKAFIEAAKNN
jgi:putative glutamine amidotransferase